MTATITFDVKTRTAHAFADDLGLATAGRTIREALGRLVAALRASGRHGTLDLRYGPGVEFAS